MEEYRKIIEQVELHKRAVLYDFFDVFQDLNVLNVEMIRNILQRVRAVVTFEEDKKVIYENSRLELEKGFGKYVGWLNQNIQQEKKLYQKSILVYPECGFLEYIKYKVPSEEKQWKDYYSRFGSLAALLLSLNGDILLPSMVTPMGCQPVIQDVSPLFQKYPAYNMNLPEYGDYRKMLGNNNPFGYAEDIREGYEMFYKGVKENEKDIQEAIQLCFGNKWWV